MYSAANYVFTRFWCFFSTGFLTYGPPAHSS